MAENFKTDFFTDRIGRGIQDIFQAQLDIATKRIYQKGRERRKVQGTGEIIQGRSGALMAAIRMFAPHEAMCSWRRSIKREPIRQTRPTRNVTG